MLSAVAAHVLRSGGFLTPRTLVSKTPIIFSTTHRVQFSELDPYNHVGTGRFATYFVDHRMKGLSQHIGWDAATLINLPFAVWVRRLEIDFVRPVSADREFTITSFVREFRGPDAFIECTMTDTTGKTLSRALMIVACVRQGYQPRHGVAGAVPPGARRPAFASITAGVALGMLSALTPGNALGVPVGTPQVHRALPPVLPGAPKLIRQRSRRR